MAMKVFGVLCLMIASSPVQAIRIQNSDSNAVHANPIRKVVNMLQAMQKKVAAEGDDETKLFEKFQCYCKNSGGDLEASISAAEAKGPAVSSDIEQAEAQHAQLQQDLKQNLVDRDDAKKAMAAATALREKEAGAFAKVKSDLDSNIAAMTSAIAALEKGMGGGFLQTANAQAMRKVALSTTALSDSDRQEILSFLGGAQSTAYAPQSGEITGILKQLNEDMGKTLSEANAAEKQAISTHDALMAAKKKEVDSLTSSIETKTARIGELAVSIVQMKNQLSDTAAGLLEDKKFLANMDTMCAKEKKEYAERQKTRGEELVALTETVKILNDDDALDLFKKTLPSAAASFVQVSQGVARRAIAELDTLRKSTKSPQLDFIALALRGKTSGFEKVIKMIDEMVVTLKQEQADDEHKLEYCAAQFDQMDDKKKSLERSISDSEAAIADAEEGLATVTEEIVALGKGIKALDKSVAGATEQRQEEHAEYESTMASNSAAKELLGYAKNRMNKFYNKALYKAAPKRELSEADRIFVNEGGTLAPTAAPGGIAGTGVTVMSQLSEAPPAPPPTGSYSKKSGESNGVLAMIDLLVKDLDKDMTEAETQEKDSQVDYEEAMSDSAAKRAVDTKALTEKSSTKAEFETDLGAHKEAKASAESELMAVHEVLSSLHAECDWLMKYFGTRKEARNGEIDSLGRAKAILSGADFA